MGCTSCYDLCSRDVFNDVLGTVDLPEGEPLELIIEHMGSGRRQTQEAETGPDGGVTIDLSDDFIQDGQSYRVEVYESGYLTGDSLMITPEGITGEYSCVAFTFETIC